MEILPKEISKIKGLERFKFYYVDVKGNIYSHKHKKLKILKQLDFNKNGKIYKLIRLADGTGKQKTFYIHQLVAKAFLPNFSNSWGVKHLDGNSQNNNLLNLEWLGRKKERNGEIGLDTDRIELSTKMSNQIKLVHYASIVKGIHTSDETEFLNGIITESLENYINKFGLKKTMYLLENS